MIQEKLRKHRRRKRIFYSTLAVTVLVSTVTAFLFFNTYLHTFSVTGLHYLSSDFVKEKLFETQMDMRYYYVQGREKFAGPKKLPMAESYTLSFKGTGHVDIAVAEKKPVAGILFAEGSYLYFDDEGYIMCTSGKGLENVPVIQGINAISPKMYEKIQIEQEGMFNEIILLARLLKEYNISADRLVYDEKQHVLMYMDTVRVNLGSEENMEGKIAELHDMQSGLEGLRGELHLENYDPKNRTGNYIFERD